VPPNPTPPDEDETPTPPDEEDPCTCTAQMDEITALQATIADLQQ
jgi:hypothetical protein